MKIKEEFPPNFSEIQKYLPATENATFCYGEIIYNPSKKNLNPDVIHHEEVHSKQQEQFTSPEIWWFKYLNDLEFRKEQEIEAYGSQYLFSKKHIEEAEERANKEGKTLRAGMTKLLKWALESMAMALSSKEYGNLLTYGEAESKIRNYKEIYS